MQEEGPRKRLNDGCYQGNSCQSVWKKNVDRRPISGIDKIPIAVTINVKYSIGSGPADAISVGDNVTSIDADRKTTVSEFLGSGVPDSHRPKCHAMVIESVGDRSGSNV